MKKLASDELSLVQLAGKKNPRMDDLKNNPAHGHLGQTFRGSNVCRDRKADEPCGPDGNPVPSDGGSEFVASSIADNAIPSHGGVLSLSSQDMHFLRSSVLEMRSSFARFQTQSHEPSSTQTVPQSKPNQDTIECNSDVSSEDIPEDIHDHTGCIQNPDPCSTQHEVTVRRRVSRPLSSKQAPLAAPSAPRIPAPNEFLVPPSPEVHGVAQDIPAVIDVQAPASEPWPDDTVGAAIRHSNGPRAAAHAVAGLGDGEGIMLRLAQQAQTMEGRSAEVLSSILDTLDQARHDGVNLTALFEQLIDTKSQLRTHTAVPGSSSSLTECVPCGKKTTLRLPRGLLPEVLTKATSHSYKNEVIVRLLGAHDDNSRLVRLQWIELLDENSERIEVPWQNVSIQGCPSGLAAEPAALLRNSTVAKEHQQSWHATLPSSCQNGPSTKTNHLEVVLRLPNDAQRLASALRVANYNSDVQLLQQGAKWMAVFCTGRMVWHGILRQGTGGADADCTMTVPLLERAASRRSQPHAARDAEATAEPASAQQPSGSGVASSVALAPDVTALSDAMLLAELERRGISIAPTPNSSTQGEVVARHVTHQAMLAHSTLEPAATFAVHPPSQSRSKSHAPAATSSEPLVKEATPAFDAGEVKSVHSYPQPEATVCGPEWVSRSVRRSSDSANMAQELVLSADANLTMPSMPAISVPEVNSSLSPNYGLSPSSQQPSGSLNMDSPHDIGDVRLADADICLADAVRQQTESFTGCLVSDRNNALASESSADVRGPFAGGRMASGRRRAGEPEVTRGPARHGGAVLAELPQQKSSSLQGDANAAPLSLQPEPMMSSHPDANSSDGLPVPQATQSSLSGALDCMGDVLDNEVLGEFAGRGRPPIPPSARRRSARGPPLSLTSGAARPDAENAFGKAAQPMAGRRGPPVDLNQSLDSLTFFQRHNRSRLTEPVLPGVQEEGSDEMAPKLPAAGASESPFAPVRSRSAGGASAKDSRREAMKHLPLAPEAAVKASVTASSAWSVQHEGLSFLMEMGESAEALSLSMDVADAEPAAGQGKEELLQWPDPDFCMPEEPTGRYLELRLFSTWGDMHYIGLSAIEVFDRHGILIALSDRIAQVTADPHSVNVLAEYGGDPRVPSNLFDGVNCTSSDLHQWLAPYSPGKVHSVRIDLGRIVSLGMLRMWNYNKSRIHSQRGVRSMEAWLGGQCIFQGEISQAPGAVHGAPQCAECIVFTSNASALDAIERHDRVYEQPAESYEVDLTPLALQAGAPEIELVPGTLPNTLQLMTRPYTAAVVPKAPPTSPRGILCRTLVVEVLSTWGDADFVGLTAVRAVDGSGKPIDLPPSSVQTDPRDLNTIAGHSGDDRTPDKLVDPVCVTTDDRHMWLAPCAHGSGRVCTITLQVASEPQLISGVMLWNYNKDAEGTLRGVGTVRVMADGKLITPECGVAVPKAPAVDAVDFGHMVPLPSVWPGMPTELMSDPPLQGGLIAAMRNPDAALEALTEAAKHTHHSMAVRQDCLTPLLPCGFVLKLVIWSTWGDPFYVGLTGVEVYDAAVGLVDISPARVNATPFSSVAVLPNMAGDARTPDKLVSCGMDGSASHSWLAPRPKCAPHEARPNIIVVMLPHAVALSKIRLWNYQKSPERGVCEMDVLIDDALIFSGYLKKASTELCHQTLMFTNSPAEIAAEVDNVTSCAGDVCPTRVTLIDEKRVRHRGETLLENPSFSTDRPSTAVVF
eukprot:jgi/Ulvmu1/5429/UM022_0224.1